MRNEKLEMTNEKGRKEKSAKEKRVADFKQEK